VDLTNEFVVAASIEEAWALLTDVERIAPCVPRFELTEAGDNEFRGTLKVKVGAVTMPYESKLRFVERDENAHRAVIEAEGREVGGHGGVKARITSQLSAEDGRTRASIVTSLTVTGRAAQFGRGILGGISNTLVGQFVTCLETRLLAPAPPAAAKVRDAEAPPRVRTVHYEPSEPIDLVSVAGGAVLKRLAPAVALLGLFALLVARRRRAR
jgi:carbon monoxide dehydrogenase subunit G